MQDFNDQNKDAPKDRLTLVQSYLAWWDIAGFDHSVSGETVNWLEQKPPKAANRKPETAQQGRPENSYHGKKPTPISSSQSSSQSLSPQNEAPLIPADQWPDNIIALHKAIASGAALPGNAYANDHIMPRLMGGNRDGDPIIDKAENKKTIMLISDFPNENDINDKILMSGKQNILITNMMLACGFQNHNIYMASLASTRPVYDELPTDDLPQIGALMHHHIGLVDPDAIISLGSAACNALLAADLMKSRENLHYFNHNRQSKKLITTFHPRSLLAKPQLKRKAWRDLQILIKKGLS